MKNWIRRLLAVALLFVWQSLVFFGTRLFNTGMVHHDLALAVDGMIPFLPWTVAIYVGSYAFWTVNGILSVSFDRENAIRFLGAGFSSLLVCLVCFLVLPTSRTRPELTGGGFWNWLLGLIYQADSPDNLFPSIHCLLSWLCWLGVKNQPRIPKWYRLFSLVFAILVFLSTLTTGQHLLVDVIAGWLLAWGSYGVWKPIAHRMAR